MSKSKRKVSPIMKNVLNLDVQLTEAVIKCIKSLPYMKNLNKYYTALEVSCHGIPWIASLLAFIWILNNSSLYQMQVNLLIAIILDIIIIAILKAITRRRRPTVNSDPLSMGPDKYSFPSGHASRSMLVFYFFKYLWPVSDIYLILILAWVFAVTMSRLLMRRHYILDITVGLLVGYIEGMFMSLLYLNPQTCLSLVSWITDEKMSGAEYDV